MHKKNEQIVITGYGVNCSNGENKEQLFKAMQQNKSGIKAIDSFECAGLPCDIAGMLETFRRDFVKENQHSDYATLFAIAAITEAIEHAAISKEQLRNSRVALCFGNANSGMQSLEQGIKCDDNKKLNQYPAHQQAENVRRHFNIKGPVFTFTSACTASSSAIGFAKQLLEDDKVDLVIAGGSDALALTIYAGFHSLQSVSPVICSPYDKKTGLSLGEGAGFLILEKQAHAEKRSGNIIAQLLATGSSLDAYHATAPNPQGAGITRSFKKALASGDIKGESIEYVNSHGTGTPANDGAELMGIKTAISPNSPLNIPISSSKSYFGHTLGAAGAIEFISSLVAIEHGYLPSTLNSEEIREDCQGFNLVVNKMLKKDVNTFASTNSAFGGHNTTLIASRVSRQSPQQNRQRVFISGFSEINADEIKTANGTNTLSVTDGDFQLKAAFPDLYRRRMSTISQYAIGSAQLAFDDSELLLAELNKPALGAYFATSLGATQVQGRNLDDLLTKGPTGIKSILFPDTVLNAALGNLSIAFGIEGCSANFSDLGNEGINALWHAFYDLQEGKISTALVCSAEDSSTYSEKVWQSYHIKEQSKAQRSGGTSFVLTNKSTDNKPPLAELSDFFAGTLLFNKSNQEWSLPSLQELASQLAEVDLVVISSLHAECESIVADILEKTCPKAQLLHKEADTISCQSLNTVVLAVQELSKSKLATSAANDNNVLTALVISINAEQSIAGCILSRLEKE
jgi:3-oxoacyl-[acyl-carrier-protein] synthase II